MPSLNLVAACIGIVAASFPYLAEGKSFSFSTSPYVEHPVHHPLEGRSGAIWRSKTGAWGENLADESLRLRGFNEIHEIKNASNNGIDRIAVKRMTDGRILDAKFVEVKTTRSAKPKLNSTRFGRQLSRTWLARNLTNMRNSGDAALKKLALELMQFRRATGLSVEHMGELTHISTKTGTIAGYSADGRSLRYSESIEGLLKNLQSKARTPQVQNWATRSLSQWDQIRSSQMSMWLGTNAAQQSKNVALTTSGRAATASRMAVLRQSRSAVATKLLQRSAGRIALVVALAIDAKDLFDTENAYRTGRISVRERNVRLASTLGGMGGAFAGAWAGGATGAWLGGFGGPFAWATIPAGGFVGAMVGGVGGYFGGSAVAGYGATAWYNSIDASVRDKFETAWLSTGAM